MPTILPLKTSTPEPVKQINDEDMLQDAVRFFYPREIVEANSGLALSFALSLDARQHPLSAVFRLRVSGCGNATLQVKNELLDEELECEGAAQPDTWLEWDVLEEVSNSDEQTIDFSVLFYGTIRPNLVDDKAAVLMVDYHGPKRSKRIVAPEAVTAPEKKRRGRGRKRKKTHHSRAAQRRICRRVDLYVDFKELNWDDWILSPMGYNAYMCVGECPNPLPARLNATNHAIVQSLINSLNNDVKAPCCVPTETSALNILYRDLNDSIVFKPYEGMRVEACGCR